jgi:hypothetical protein
MEKARHQIFDSGGFSVRLTEQEYELFRVEQRRFQLRWMRIEHQARGIWASNQNKYVKSLEELNAFDIKPDPEILKCP